ncbi:hypothetical protein [Caballeronia sp. dw_276]|uniref:hypothetical protein n=1 Tax=Caballeronia sp. dw_276 TaxID=2719795 RepID=UPI001BD28D16|nr:hypothetical protein [Caballeronia sp. dw_276]
MHGDLSAIAKHLIAMLNQSTYLTTADITEALPHADHDAVGIEMDMLMRAGVVTRGFVRHSEPLDVAYWLEHKPRPAGVVGPGVVTANDFASASEVSNG